MEDRKDVPPCVIGQGEFQHTDITTTCDVLVSLAVLVAFGFVFLVVVW
jgi:hypothetical protein